MQEIAFKYVSQQERKVFPVPRKNFMKRTASLANDVACGFYEDVMGSLALVLRDPERYCDAVAKADETARTSEEFDALVSSTVSATEHELLVKLGELTGHTPGDDAVQLRRWSHTKVVYCLDPDTSAALALTDWGDADIPGEVLRRLPHPNPMVVLPHPIVLPISKEECETYRAFTVTGMTHDRRRCGTHDKQAEYLVLQFLGHVTDTRTGKPVSVHVPSLWGAQVRKTKNLVGMRVITPLADASMGERREIAAQDMYADRRPESFTGFTTFEEGIAAAEEFTQIGLSLLTYLACENVDVTIPSQAPVARRGKRQGEPANVILLGYRLGASLRSHRLDTNPHEEGTRTVAPHVRRAHVHTFRRGPAKSERFLKWLHPILVNAERGIPVSQVHVRRENAVTKEG